MPQVRSVILDGLLEVADALVDPSLLRISDLRSFATVLSIGVGVVFLGASKVLEDTIGKTAAVATGLMLTIALLSRSGAIPIVAAVFLVLAAAMKLVSGIGLGTMMAQDARMAGLASAAIGGSTWALSTFLPVLGLDFLAALKLLIVTASGVGTYGMLRGKDLQRTLSSQTICGISAVIAAVGLVDADVLMDSLPGLGKLARLSQGAFGVGAAGGLLWTSIKRRRCHASRP